MASEKINKGTADILDEVKARINEVCRTIIQRRSAFLDSQIAIKQSKSGLENEEAVLNRFIQMLEHPKDGLFTSLADALVSYGHAEDFITELGQAMRRKNEYMSKSASCTFQESHKHADKGKFPAVINAHKTSAHHEILPTPLENLPTVSRQKFCSSRASEMRGVDVCRKEMLTGHPTSVTNIEEFVQKTENTLKRKQTQIEDRDRNSSVISNRSSNSSLIDKKKIKSKNSERLPTHIYADKSPAYLIDNSEAASFSASASKKQHKKQVKNTEQMEQANILRFLLKKNEERNRCKEGVMDNTDLSSSSASSRDDISNVGCEPPHKYTKVSEDDDLLTLSDDTSDKSDDSNDESDDRSESGSESDLEISASLGCGMVTDQNDVDLPNQSLPYGKACYICEYMLPSSVVRTLDGQRITIKSNITCETVGVVYAIICTKCDDKTLKVSATYCSLLERIRNLIPRIEQNKEKISKHFDNTDHVLDKDLKFVGLETFETEFDDQSSASNKKNREAVLQYWKDKLGGRTNWF